MGQQRFRAAKKSVLVLSGAFEVGGQKPPDNTENLLSAIEANILKEAPEVQWAMNFTTGWVGVYEEQYRKRCISLGEETGLYKDEKVSIGCTPNYLPLFISIGEKAGQINNCYARTAYCPLLSSRSLREISFAFLT